MMTNDLMKEFNFFGSKRGGEEKVAFGNTNLYQVIKGTFQEFDFSVG